MNVRSRRAPNRYITRSAAARPAPEISTVSEKDTFASKFHRRCQIRSVFRRAGISDIYLGAVKLQIMQNCQSFVTTDHCVPFK
jgi:hypothetical protein